MRPLTEDLPKALLEVNGRPFVDYQLESLHRAGVREVVFCVGHLAGRIQAFVGDGRRWGVKVAYSDEEDRKLGTAGALRLACDSKLLQGQFLSVYGDCLPTASAFQGVGAWLTSGCSALLTVYRCGPLDVANATARLEGDLVSCFDRTSLNRVDSRLRHADYGLHGFNSEVISQFTTSGQRDGVGRLHSELARRKDLFGFEVAGAAREIGSLAGLRELETELGADGELSHDS